MALLSDYTAGTVSVAAGGTAVTGVGTAWLTAGFAEGDEFFAPGWHGIVQSVNSNTSLTLYPTGIRGAALAGAAYRLRYQGDGSRLTAQARQLIELLGGTGNFQAFAGLNGAADKVPRFTGAGTMTLDTVTAFMRTLLDDANGVAAYGTLGTIPDAQLPASLKANAPFASDLDAITDSGWYRAASSTPGIPVAQYGFLQHITYDANTAVQVYFRGATAQRYVRRKASGTWQSWVMTVDQLLGTVSQSSGAPTGAIIERGSNANGEYVRFADGAQFCTLTDATLTYSSTSRLAFPWTFPASFPGSTIWAGVMLPASGASFQNVAIQNCGASWSSRGSNSAQIGINNAGATNFASNSQVTGCSLLAFGRWF
ncbi:hypothetical protein J2046_003015 [Rhizobium petrolearium]|uniref:pyocin knob domain-containing protein n=1 Tax=Neorhizobium petrolearium TaxID=515361 RepID=UPI001AE631D1|nr:pyocin knob domain-containing protein [Neorhizobium petrolearium]MBP1844748.1 hypothetical protein [Neorhizobium petrolearium]